MKKEIDALLKSNEELLGALETALLALKLNKISYIDGTSIGDIEKIIARARGEAK